MTRAGCHFSLFILSLNETHPVLLLGTASREALHKALNYTPPACLQLAHKVSRKSASLPLTVSLCSPGCPPPPSSSPLAAALRFHPPLRSELRSTWLELLWPQGPHIHVLQVCA